MRVHLTWGAGRSGAGGHDGPRPCNGPASRPAGGVEKGNHVLLVHFYCSGLDIPGLPACPGMGWTGRDGALILRSRRDPYTRPVRGSGSANPGPPTETQDPPRCASHQRVGAAQPLHSAVVEHPVLPGALLQERSTCRHHSYLRCAKPAKSEPIPAAAAIQLKTGLASVSSSKGAPMTRTTPMTMKAFERQGGGGAS